MSKEIAQPGELNEYQRLAEGIIVQAAFDYRIAYFYNRKGKNGIAIGNFFESEGFSLLSSLDGKLLRKQIERGADAFREQAQELLDIGYESPRGYITKDNRITCRACGGTITVRRSKLDNRRIVKCGKCTLKVKEKLI